MTSYFSYLVYKIFLAADTTAKGINSNSFGNIGSMFGGNPNSLAAPNCTAGVTCVQGIIGTTLQILLLVAGGIAVLFLIVGGFRYIMAYGNEEQTESAKKTITNSIVGLVIIILSFAIVRMIAAILLQGPAGV